MIADQTDLNSLVNTEHSDRHILTLSPRYIIGDVRNVEGSSNTNKVVEEHEGLKMIKSRI